MKRKTPKQTLEQIIGVAQDKTAPVRLRLEYIETLAKIALSPKKRGEKK